VRGEAFDLSQMRDCFADPRKAFAAQVLNRNYLEKIIHAEATAKAGSASGGKHVVRTRRVIARGLG